MSNSSFTNAVPVTNSSVTTLYLKFILRDSYGNTVTYTYTLTMYSPPAPVTTTDQANNVPLELTVVGIILIGIGALIGLDKKYNVFQKVLSKLNKKNE